MIRSRSTAYDRNEFRLIQYAKLLFISFPDAQDNVFVFFFSQEDNLEPVSCGSGKCKLDDDFPIESKCAI